MVRAHKSIVRLSPTVLGSVRAFLAENVEVSALPIAVGIALGLQYLHCLFLSSASLQYLNHVATVNDITHGDIKPVKITHSTCLYS